MRARIDTRRPAGPKTIPSVSKRLKRGPRTFAAIFEEAALRRELEELEKGMAGADFWKDQAAAQKVLQRRKRVEAELALL